MRVTSFSVAPAQNPAVAEEPLLVGIVNVGGLSMLKHLLTMAIHQKSARGEEGVAAFMRAAYLNRVDMMKLFSPEYGLNLNERNESGETALMQAAKNKSHDAMAWLIRAGADVNIMDHSGSTPLLEYVKSLSPSLKFNPEMLKLFINAYLDFDAVDADGRTALMLLAKNPGPAKDFMLEAMKGQAGINAIDNNGCTALHFAAEHRHYEFGGKLVMAGAVVRTVANDGRMARDVAMDAAENARDYGFAKFLDDVGDHHSMEVRLAAREGLADMIPIWNKFYGHGEMDESQSDLTRRVRFSELGMGKLIRPARHETDFSELGRLSLGDTDMLAAAKSGDRNHVSFVLKSDAVNIDVRDSLGRSPLMCAAVAKDPGFLKFFIEELDINKIKFNVKLVDDFGQDALIMSAQRGNEGNMKLLLQRGADVNIFDKNGDDALIAYLTRKITEAKEKYAADQEIRAKGVEGAVDSDVRARSKEEKGKVDADTLRLLLNGKVNAGRPSNALLTATMLLCGTTGTEAKEIFLKAAGVMGTIDSADLKGLTALMYAVTTRDKDYFRMLIDAGADVNLQVNGTTARSLAQKLKLEQFVQIIDAAAERKP